jgi:hypothetical protein
VISKKEWSQTGFGNFGRRFDSFEVLLGVCIGFHGFDAHCDFPTPSATIYPTRVPETSAPDESPKQSSARGDEIIARDPLDR